MRLQISRAFPAWGKTHWVAFWNVHSVVPLLHSGRGVPAQSSALILLQLYTWPWVEESMRSRDVPIWTTPSFLEHVSGNQNSRIPCPMALNPLSGFVWASSQGPSSWVRPHPSMCPSVTMVYVFPQGVARAYDAKKRKGKQAKCHRLG